MVKKCVWKCLKCCEMNIILIFRVRKIYLVHRKEDVKVFLIWFQLTLSNFHSKIHEIWLAEAVAEAALIKNLCYFRSSDYRRFLVSWRFWWNLRPKLHLWEMNEYSRDNHHHCWCWSVCVSMLGSLSKEISNSSFKILDRGGCLQFLMQFLAFNKYKMKHFFWNRNLSCYFSLFLKLCRKYVSLGEIEHYFEDKS